MDDLIGILFSNIAIVLAILGGLYSVFARNTDKKKDKPDYGSSGRTIPKPGQGPSTFDSDATPREMGRDLETYAKQQRERYEQTQRQQSGRDTISDSSIGGRNPEDEHNALPDEELPNYYEREYGTPYKRDKMKPYKKKEGPSVSLLSTSKLSKKKLAESIIMAEVLGKPRSQKTFRSK